MQLTRGKEVVLAIGDLHFPFEHPDTFEFLKVVRDMFEPTKVVCMGDEIDAYSLSTYIHDPDGMSAGLEHDKAIEKLKNLYKLFPEVMVCLSNHTMRPYKRATEAGLPAKFFKSYKEFLEAPKGWEWRDNWVIDDVIYEHGEGCSGENGARNAAKGNMRSTVIGHIHSFAGINYISTPDRLLFGFNVGCLIDKTAYAFAYGRHFKSKPIIGVGVVNRGVPMFIPMVLNNKGRWIGVI